MRVYAQDSLINAASAIKGISISVIASLVSKVINAVAYLWIVTLLDPAQLGVVALGLSFYAMFGPFRDFGLTPAMVARKELTPTVLSTAYRLRWSLALGLVVAGIVASVSAPLAFGEDSLRMMILLLTLGYLIEPFGFLSSALLQREFKFGILATADVSSIAAMAGVTVVSAIFGYELYALFFGIVAYMVVRTVIVISYRRPPQTPLEINPTERSALLSFGSKLVASGICVYLLSNLNVLALGGIDITALGYYGLAFLWASTPADVACGAIGRVLLPTYSSMKGDRTRIMRAYSRTMRHLSILALFAFVVLLTTSPVLISAIYGSVWENSIPVLLILLVYGLTRTLVEPAGTLLLANEEAGLILRANIVALVVMAALVVPVAVLWGGIGCAALIALAYLIYASMIWTFEMRSFRQTFSQFAAPAFRPLVATCISMALYFLLGVSLTGSIQIVGQIAMALTSFIGVLYFTAREDLIQSIRYALNILKPVR